MTDLALGPGYLSSRLCGLDKAPCLYFLVSKNSHGGLWNPRTEVQRWQDQLVLARVTDGWSAHYGVGIFWREILKDP